MVVAATYRDSMALRAIFIASLWLRPGIVPAESSLSRVTASRTPVRSSESDNSESMLCQSVWAKHTLSANGSANASAFCLSVTKES